MSKWLKVSQFSEFEDICKRCERKPVDDHDLQGNPVFNDGLCEECRRITDKQNLCQRCGENYQYPRNGSQGNDGLCTRCRISATHGGERKDGVCRGCLVNYIDRDPPDNGLCVFCKTKTNCKNCGKEISMFEAWLSDAGIELCNKCTQKIDDSKLDLIEREFAPEYREIKDDFKKHLDEMSGEEDI